MSKKWVFALMAAATVAAAAACRYWQRATAFEPDGLVRAGMPATYCLLAVVVLAAVAFGLLGRQVAGDRAFTSYLDAFSLPCKGLLAVYCAAGVLLVAGGVLGWAEWKELGLSAKALRVLLVPTGLSVALVGWLNAQGREARGRFAWPVLLPGYCGVLWMLATYQARSTEPAVMGYVFAFFGGVGASIACYAFAAFSFEKPLPTLAVWSSGTALGLLAAAMVDAYVAEDTVQMLVTAGYGLYLIAQAKCLVVNAQRPPELARWTPPQDAGDESEEPEETQEEVDSHE